MQVEESRWTPKTGWRIQRPAPGSQAALVIYFGDRDALQSGSRFAELQAAYPGAHLIGASTGASILGDDLHEDSIVASAISFAHTDIAVAQCDGITGENSLASGEAIARKLAAPGLAGVFVLADGLRVNGSLLTAGLNRVLGGSCPVTGGMAADHGAYQAALAGVDAPPASGMAAAVGFYGRTIRIVSSHACGWDAFGPRRRITRAAANVLFELDEKPALELYERYLGDDISGGTGAGVIFPLLISPPDRPQHAVVRALLNMDRDSGAMTFAGNMPEGWTARLMRGNVDRLALGAADAARRICAAMPAKVEGDRLALMVTCIGRWLLMGQRTVDELSFARDEFGPDMRSIGFYSYGEIAPADHSGDAELHNQTMTIVGLAEIES